MRLRKLLCPLLAVAGLTLTPGLGDAQTPQQPGLFVPVQPSSEREEPVAAPPDEGRAAGGRLYGSTDYLLWWVKAAPLSVPLVSTSTSANKEGFLVNSGTTILYGAPQAPAVGGNSTQNFPQFSGTRLTLGCWLDEDHIFGIEGSGFLLERRSAGFAVRGNANGVFTGRSDPSGDLGVRVPVFNNVPYAPGGTVDPETGLGLVPQTEDGVPVALPDEVTGGVRITNSLRLWGADVVGTVNLGRGSSWELTGLAGFRYLDLYESLDLNLDITGLAEAPMFAGQSGTLFDHFQTRNQFYGGLVGLRGSYLLGPLSVDLTGRLALGSNHEVLNISGGYQASNFKVPFMSGPEGIFAQPANEGRTSSNAFAVVPEGQVKLGYALTSRLRATVGYDFLYISNVIRPGDQINREIPKGQTFQQDNTPPPLNSPVRLFRTTDFYAQGVSLGLEFRY